MKSRITDPTCHICYKTYSGISQLYRHLREVHNDYEKTNSAYGKNECTFKCLEGCDVSYKFSRDLRSHLNGYHNFNIFELNKQFSSLTEFGKWLTQLQEGGVQFIKHRGCKAVDGKKVTYYVCNRSGLIRTKTNDRKRRPKKNGSRKINAGCTSYLKLEEIEKCCIVTYCDFHYGHKIELEHLPLSVESRMAIVKKLEGGANLLRISLKTDDVEFESVQRSDLLTPHDLISLKNFCKRNKEKQGLPMPLSNYKKDLEKIDSFVSSKNSKDNDEKESVFMNTSNLGMGSKEKNIIYFRSDPLVKNEHCTEESNTPNDNRNIDMHYIQGLKPETLNSISRNIEVHFVEETVKEEGNTSHNDQNIEVHYVDDTEEMSDTEEDVFGYYVAEMLKKIDPNKRGPAREQIDQILKNFLK